MIVAEKIPEGLRVWDTYSKNEVTLGMDKKSFMVSFSHGPVNELCGLNFSRLVHWVFYSLDMFRHAEYILHSRTEQGRPVGFNVIRWCQNKYGRIINTILYPHWVEWRDQCDPEVVKLARMLWSTNYRHVPSGMFRNILNASAEDRYLIPDLLRYRYLRMLAMDIVEPALVRQAQNELMSRPIIRRTMVEMPGGIGAPIFTYVRRGFEQNWIRRRLHNRLEWIAAGGICRALEGRQAEAEKFAKIFERTSPEQLERAYQILAREYGIHNRKRSYPIANLFMDIVDAANEISERATLVRAVEVSVNWHRQVMNLSPEPPEDAVFCVPPWPAPEDSRFELILSPARLSREGAEMGHCVATYWRQCAEGQSYIYAFNDPQLGRATVEVNEEGYIVQSRGPHNQDTKAARLAGELLGRHIARTFLSVPVEMELCAPSP